MNWLFLAAAVLLVALGGVLASADSALSMVSRADLLELATKSRASRSIRAIAADIGAHINVVNFVRILAETSAAVLVTIVLAFNIEQLWLALVLAALIMAAVSFVLVGSSPRSVGRVHTTRVILSTAWLVHVLRVVLGPIASGLVAMGDKVTPGRPRSRVFSSEEQLLSMVDEATELDVIEEDDRELIHSIFEFGETVVREVMIPRTDMLTIDDDATVGTAMGLFLSKGISRMPVVADDVDEIAGILYLRDVAQFAHERGIGSDDAPVRRLARPAVFVPESKKADATLRQMQLDSIHLAMVVDEYGGIAGLVTLEDLIEELVGDISDEYDRAVVQVEELAEGRFRISARLPVDELGELFGLELDDDDVDSAGGLLAKQLGRLPQPGQTVTVHGLRLKAERVEGRRKRITTIVVERAEPIAEGTDEQTKGTP